MSFNPLLPGQRDDEAATRVASEAIDAGAAALSGLEMHPSNVSSVCRVFADCYRSEMYRRMGNRQFQDPILTDIRAVCHPFIFRLVDNEDDPAIRLNVTNRILNELYVRGPDSLSSTLRGMPSWAIRMIVDDPSFGTLYIPRWENHKEAGPAAAQVDTACEIELALRTAQSARAVYDRSGVARAIESRLQRASPQLDIGGLAPLLQTRIGSFCSSRIDSFLPVLARAPVVTLKRKIDADDAVPNSKQRVE